MSTITLCQIAVIFIFSNPWLRSFTRTFEWIKCIYRLIFVVGILLGETCTHDEQCSGAKNATVCLHVQSGKVCSCQHDFVAIKDNCFRGQYSNCIFKSDIYSGVDYFSKETSYVIHT